MKKRNILLIVLFLINLVFITSSVFAIDLDVNTLLVSNSVLTDLERPAVFDLVIENKEEGDTFEIYSLIGVDISPENFSINSNSIKTIQVLVMPQSAIQKKKGFLTFEYLIKNSKDEVQRETLTINIVDLESSFDIIPQNINPNSDKTTISIKNKISKDFNGINLKISSVFFEYEETLVLDALETKEIEIPLDNDKMKGLDAGSYLVNSIITIEGKTANKESMLRFLEQEDMVSEDSINGLIKRRQEVIKHNVGNIKKSVNIVVKRNLISSLFTSFNIEPTKKSFKGLNQNYVWEKTLVPNEELKIIIITNWFYPIFIIILFIVLIPLYKKSISNSLIINKKVSFVQTKGGQFALKVMLRVKAKGFVERINILDKLPPLVKLYEKFGAVAPNDIDLKNRRLEWGIESLNAGEERVFSYIIYSKIGVVGRFELPSAKAIYEKEGKLKEVISNRAFYINEAGSS